VTLTIHVELNGVRVPFVLDDDALAAIAAALERPIDDSARQEWMNVESAARYLDVSPERVRKLVARREIPFTQEAPGCRVFFSRSDLAAWMCSSAQPPGCHHTNVRAGGALR
jgi:excisionase family DNA binding protein